MICHPYQNASKCALYPKIEPRVQIIRTIYTPLLTCFSCSQSGYSVDSSDGNFVLNICNTVFVSGCTSPTGKISMWLYGAQGQVVAFPTAHIPLQEIVNPTNTIVAILQLHPFRSTQVTTVHNPFTSRKVIQNIWQAQEAVLCSPITVEILQDVLLLWVTGKLYSTLCAISLPLHQTLHSPMKIRSALTIFW
jgi:hypothetical protein